MKIIIATRSNNGYLYELAQRFWPARLERKQMGGYNDWRDALRYLHDLLSIDADYVVNCDEDCFVYDWQVVEDLIADMRANKGVYAGMADTTDNCHHRNNCSEVMNPFFNVFDPKVARAALVGTPWYSNAVLLGHKPPCCQYDEIFNVFFHALSERVGRFELLGSDHRDGISTELSYGKRPFALHSWYSREYLNVGPHQGRIDALHREAMELRVACVVGARADDRHVVGCQAPDDGSDQPDNGQRTTDNARLAPPSPTTDNRQLTTDHETRCHRSVP